MGKNFGYTEDCALPLGFKYLEVHKREEQPSTQLKKENFLKCKKYQTEFHERKVPYKAITRLL